MIWSWGEYKGRKVQRVPLEYLEWVARVFDRGSKWQKVATYEVEARRRRQEYAPRIEPLL